MVKLSDVFLITLGVVTLGWMVWTAASNPDAFHVAPTSHFCTINSGPVCPQ